MLQANLSKVRFWIALMVVAIIPLLVARVEACTIFVLTDGRHTLFFNNEDWSNPRSRIWFVPAPEGFHSSVYVGFENQGSEGGMNTEGLAFDWVAGFAEEWEPPASQEPVGGRTSERMLETCATVEEAIAFYKKYREPQFARAKIMVADKTGASAIIGAKAGKLEVLRSKDSRGFGYGRESLQKMLKKETVPSLETGVKILNACRQDGPFATKYSSVFDLTSGDIFLFLPGSDDATKLNLRKELGKGARYYDLPEIRVQLSEEAKPLLSNMRRFLTDVRPIEDREPMLTARIGAMIQDAHAGRMRAEDYNPELWTQLEPNQKAIQADLSAFGEFVGARLVEKGADGLRHYGYKIEFTKAWVHQDFRLDSEGRVALSESKGIEWKK